MIKVLIATLMYDLRRLSSIFRKPEDNSGFIVEEGYVSPEICDLIYNKVLTVLSQGQELQQSLSIDKRGRQGYDDGMIDIKNIDIVIPDILSSIKIDDIFLKLKSLSSETYEVESVHCYYNRGVVNTRVLHADSHAKSQFKAFIYLTDVIDEGDGPYCYVPGSSNFSFTRYFTIVSNYLTKKHVTDFDTEQNRKAMKKLCGRKGSLIVSNQNGAHRGWPQKEDRERMLISLNLVER